MGIGAPQNGGTAQFGRHGCVSQMRYAATLLHDVRTRQGFSVGVARRREPQGEGYCGDGHGCSGRASIGGNARQALDEADKKSPWRDACSLAPAQSRKCLRLCRAAALQAGRGERPINVLPPIHPMGGQGPSCSRPASAVQTDKKSGLSAPVTFWRRKGTEPPQLVPKGHKAWTFALPPWTMKGILRNDRPSGHVTRLTTT